MFARRLFFRVILGLAGVFMGLTASELSIRLLSALGCARVSMKIWTLDPYYGRAAVPGGHSWLPRRGDNRPVYYRYNSLGLRGAEVPPKNPDLYRILILGDSMTEGSGVDENRVFGRRLEELLNSGLPRRHYEVISGGTPGWGTDSELLYLRRRGREIRPDLVLVAFYMGNDLSDNTYELRDQSGMNEGSAWQPYFELNPDGEGLLLRNYPVPVEKYLPGRSKRWLGAHSMAWCVLSEAVHHSMGMDSLLRHLRVLMPAPTAAPAPPSFPFVLQPYCTTCATREKWGKAFKITDFLIEELKKESMVQGAKFGMVLIPYDQTVVRRQPSELFDRYPAMRSEHWDFNVAYARIDGSAKARGVPLLDAWQPFRAYPDPSALYIWGDIHLSNDGHAYLAALLKRFLLQAGLVPYRPK